uniref:Uncharacterized protein n=2 Tax=Oryza meridionalis TaxID=40149 RepID=A0A0E0ET67_9ORYZ
MRGGGPGSDCGEARHPQRRLREPPSTTVVAKTPPSNGGHIGFFLAVAARIPRFFAAASVSSSPRPELAARRPGKEERRGSTLAAGRGVGLPKKPRGRESGEEPPAMETTTERRRLFATEKVGGRAVYRVQAATVAAGILLVLYYRATRVPAAGEGRAAWLGMAAAELWFAAYWVITQSVRWCPVRRRTFKNRLAERYEENLPGVDIYVCTADPYAEPPSLVISTILSVMAYNYPSEKISVYLSDDGGSILTFYGLWEASMFAKKWLPFCRRYNIEPRSPAAYFSESEGHHNLTCMKK